MDKMTVHEFSKNVAAVIRRVEHGATILITVAGRPVASIVPPQPGRGDLEPDHDAGGTPGVQPKGK
jgi:prevent-host-death family protein